MPIDSEAVQGSIYGQLGDLQGRFNVNNLIDNNGEVNPAIREEEISRQSRFAAALEDYLASATLGLDAVRVVLVN